MPVQLSANLLGRNSVWALVQVAWQMISRFALIPLIIAKIGIEGYGTWTLLFSICAYATTFNVGFGFAYTKFTAEYDRKQDYKTLSEIVSSGMALIVVLAVVVLTAIWLFRVELLEFFGVPGQLIPDAAVALIIISICLVLHTSIGSTLQILVGLQRIDLQVKVLIIASGIEFGVALMLLFAGRGILALATGHLCGTVVSALIGWILCRKHCPALRISPMKISRRGSKLVASLGGRFQAVSFLNVNLLNQGLRLLISGLCGVAVLGTFELASKLLEFGKRISGVPVTPLMPAFANLHTGGDEKKWQSLYERSSKTVSIVAMVTLGFLAAFADQLIYIWTGDQYPLVVWTVRVLVTAEFALMLTAVATACLRGEGTLRLEAARDLISVVLVAVASFPAFHAAEYAGLVLAVTVSQLVAITWFLGMFGRARSISFIRHLQDVVLRPAAIVLPVTGLLVVVTHWLGFAHPALHGRWPMLAFIGVIGLVYVLTISVLLWRAFLTASERTIVTGMLPFLQPSR